MNTPLHELFALPYTEDEIEIASKVMCVPGAIIPHEIICLYRIATSVCQGSNNGAILEIGSYRGRSTASMGYAISGTRTELFCLDVWGGQGTHFVRQKDDSASVLQSSEYAVMEDFLKNTAFIGDNLRVLRGETRQFVDFLPAGYFDFIFIDADHEYEPVRMDIEVAFKCLKPGGILLGHDYHLGQGGEGVVKAVTELIGSNPNIPEKGGIPNTSIWYARCPMPLSDYYRSQLLRFISKKQFEDALYAAEQSLEFTPEASDLVEIIDALKLLVVNLGQSHA